MKATEIQIGDWVLVQDTPRKVTQLTKHKIGYHLTKNECVIHYARMCDIKPIPLTVEILEKNIPFERFWDATKSNPKGSVTEWRMDIDMATIFVRDFRDKKGEYILEIHIRGSANYGVKKNIYYIHEFQHCLRLCGLDELADNFKIE